MANVVDKMGEDKLKWLGYVLRMEETEPVIFIKGTYSEEKKGTLWWKLRLG